MAVLQPHGALAASLACCDASHARLHDSQQRLPLSDAVVDVVRIAPNAAGVVCRNGSIVAAVADSGPCRTTNAHCGGGQAVVVEAAAAGGGHAGVVCVVWRGCEEGAHVRTLQSFALDQVW